MLARVVTVLALSSLLFACASEPRGSLQSPGGGGGGNPTTAGANATNDRAPSSTREVASREWSRPERVLKSDAPRRDGAITCRQCR